MRVQSVIALGLTALATSACGQLEKDHNLYPNGTGYHGEVSVAIAELFPENVFPQARKIARLCDEQKDLAACARAASFLVEGARVPVDRADETTDEPRFPVPDAKYAAIEPNQEAGLKIYQEVCAAGYTGACTALADLQLKGIGGTVEQGAQYFVDACDKGIAGACSKTLELQKAGALALSDAALNARLEAACNAGVAEACELNAGDASRYGVALAPASSNPTFVEIRKRAAGTTVLVYTDNPAEAAAITARAQEAFGDSVNVSVRAAQGSAPTGWTETLPQLFVLAAAQEGNATVRLSKNGIAYNGAIADATKKAGVQSALERLAGQGELRANLDQPVAEEEAEVAAGGNVVGGESADALAAE